MIDKTLWIKRLKEEVVALRNLQIVVSNKKPHEKYLLPTIEFAIYEIVNAVIILEGKNPYLMFDEAYFMNRQVQMHQTFFVYLVVGIEDGLKDISKQKNIQIENSFRKNTKEIVNRIEHECKEPDKIRGELNKILKLGMNQPSFEDCFNSVLKAIPNLSKKFANPAKIYLKGISILRHRGAHPERIFTVNEVKILKQAGFSKAVNDDGTMKMTFEGYKFILGDIIFFFDNIYALL